MLSRCCTRAEVLGTHTTPAIAQPASLIKPWERCPPILEAQVVVHQMYNPHTKCLPRPRPIRNSPTLGPASSGKFSPNRNAYLMPRPIRLRSRLPCSGPRFRRSLVFFARSLFATGRDVIRHHVTTLFHSGISDRLPASAAGGFAARDSVQRLKPVCSGDSLGPPRWRCKRRRGRT